jgi:P27 family predicted phage terminase small subunit
MPRKSAASLSIISGKRTRPYLRPPASLGKVEREVWKTIVTDCPAEHFSACDGALLAQYCRVAVQAEQAEAALASQGMVAGGHPNPWLKIQAECTKQLCSLSMRLRISPQARMRREQTGLRGPGPSAYETMEDDE